MTSLLDQMAKTFESRDNPDHVPAASVAVAHAGTVTSTAWGVPDDALYQAASISKPIAAATALRLVARGTVGLDDDVNGYLQSWRLPIGDDWAARVTIRHLLSHSGSLTVHGFPGYPAGTPQPTLPQILDGRAPANTPPVRLSGVPGLTFRYSGGGYSVLQQLLEDVTGTTFAELATTEVLAPAGMTTATYDQPAADRAAIAHVDGRPVDGGWHRYPEQAAAGLWCTPTDLLHFATAIRDSATGASDTLLPRELAVQMLSAQVPDMGLGLQLEPDPVLARFGHGGGNHGYLCQLLASTVGDYAVAVMTNSGSAFPLLESLVDTAMTSVGWPHTPRPAPEGPPMPDGYDQLLDWYGGNYVTDSGTTVEIVITEDFSGYLLVPGQPRLRLTAIGRSVNQAVDARTELVYHPDTTGRVTKLTIRQDGQELTAHRR